MLAVGFGCRDPALAVVGAGIHSIWCAVRLVGVLDAADSGNHRIQVFNPNGRFLRTWGQVGSADGSFRNPEDVAIDSQGRVFVADTGNNRVQVFNRSGGFLTQFSASAIAPAGFRPNGLALDIADRVFVTETDNDRIEAFTPAR